MDNKICFNISDEQKDELIKQLVSFVPTDTLLFLPVADEKVQKTLQTVNTFFNTEYVLSCGIEVLPQNVKQGEKVEQYLKSISGADIAFIYLAGKELRSVLLAVLLGTKKLKLQQAFDLAFYEELYQQRDWGKTEEIVKRQQNIFEKLVRLCEQYDKRSVS